VNTWRNNCLANRLQAILVNGDNADADDDGDDDDDDDTFNI